MVSIVIPVFNMEFKVGNAIRSVLDQTFQLFEIVVVDDGSIDRSLQELNKFDDDRIKIISQTNQGVAIARNTGIKTAKYKYIAFLDADDEWLPQYLESNIQLINNFPQCSVFGSAYYMKDYQGVSRTVNLKKIPFSGEQGILTNYFEVATNSEPPLWTSAVLVSRDAILAIGGFPTGIRSGEDLLTWAKLAITYKIAYTNTPLAIYNLDKSRSYNETPSRMPADVDIVGKELEYLLKENPHTLGLREYLSLWFKMRSAIFLLLNHREKSFAEALKSLKYNLKNIKVFLYIFSLILPVKTRLKFFRLFTQKN